MLVLLLWARTCQIHLLKLLAHLAVGVAWRLPELLARWLLGRVPIRTTSGRLHRRHRIGWHTLVAHHHLGILAELIARLRHSWRHRRGSWIVGGLPELRNLELELLGLVEVLILNSCLLLALQLSQLLAHLGQPRNRRLQLLGQVEVLLAHCLLLLLLKFPDLVGGLGVEVAARPLQAGVLGRVDLLRG